MKGLTIILAEAAPERLRAALMLATANAALGGRARLFFQDAAVALLRSPLTSDADTAHAAAGLPTLADLLEEAFALGVEICACQSGLALCGLTTAALDQRVGYEGPLSILQTAAEDRLLIA